ncbi:family 4B encapsulin nanocompartment shell protein [Thermococcus atlanticus]
MDEGLGMREEVEELLRSAINELTKEGLNPDIMLAGPKFISYAGDFLSEYALSVYKVDELEYDAVIADSQYLGQMRKASRRVSIEPLLKEKAMWEEFRSIDV